MLFFALIALLSFITCHGLGVTDTITWGGDSTRSGYQTNHNMDPAVVASPQFGQIFKTQLPGRYGGVPEQVFASPLVYTPGDGVQYVYLATQQNNIYKIDAKTGAIVMSRNLHIPFLTADLDGCVDINPHVGSTATGVIDPSTGTWYLTTKTYVDQNPNGAKGRPNGRYYFHAISTDDLSERPGFPTDLEGKIARNNPERMFTGGIHHQRPALLHSGQYIYAGFASHCVQYNFTGWIMGWDKSSGAVVEAYATEGAGVKNTVPGGGVWMSGGGLASDGRGSMFFSTGNGYASQLKGIPVAGRQPPTSLEEAAVHMTIADDGKLTPVDFFMPWEKQQLDGADKDLGTSPLQILPSAFSCGAVSRMGVVTGKSGKTYWINLDNMGGYQNGPGKLDAVLQTYQNENSVYAGAGVYPLEGGYIYINVIQYKTHVFKFSCDAGVPTFTKVADSPEVNAYILGVGHGTVTSLNDRPGTGLVWTSDVDGANLRIYNAVPQNGQLTLIKSFNVPGTTKFQRPVFGDGRVYHTTTQGFFYGFGSPVNLPLNCTTVDFGAQEMNTTSAYKTIQCQALVATQITGLTVNGKNFVLGNSTLPTLAKGATYTFSAAFSPTQVGPLSTDILVNTTAVGGYTATTPVRLSGNGQSVSAVLLITPNTVSFEGVITGQAVSEQSMILNNLGNSNLTVTGIECSTTVEKGPFTALPLSNNVTCGAFTLSRLPISIAGNGQATASVAFNPTTSGNFVAFVAFNTNGGRKVVTIVGVSGTQAAALLEFQTPDGLGWVKYDNSTPFNFGDVMENTSRNLKMRLTNTGGNDSSRLSITVSKPPFGVPGIIGAVNQVDLAEGINLAPGESATATLYCSVPKSQINVDSYKGTAQWTMNLGDPAFGKQFIQFTCNAVAEQSAPLYANGTAKYRYLGCFRENNPGRQLQQQLYGSDALTNQMCIKSCSDQGYKYAGTQYHRECWCGNYPPYSANVSDLNCNFDCTGDIGSYCGGDGVDHTASHISIFADPSAVSPAAPGFNPGVNGYTSLGCYTEAPGRALTVAKNLGKANSVANCTAACKGYTYAGVEYGAECYCGNSLTQGSVPAPASDCNMLCAGNITEYCGAGGRLNLYQLAAAPSSSALASSSAPASSAASSAPASSAPASSAPASSAPASSAPASSVVSSAAPVPTGPVIVQSIGNYTYLNCQTEPKAGRALTGKMIGADDMTVEKCSTFCAGFTYFGLEYARECFCGNTLDPLSLVATDGRCKMTCPGNKLQICGGSVGLTMYQVKNVTAPASSAPASSAAASSAAASSAPASSAAASSAPASSAPASSAPASSAPASSAPASSAAASSAPASSAPASSANSSAPASSAASSAPASSAPASSAASSAPASSAASSAPASSAPASSAAASSASSSAPAPSASVKSDWQLLGCANETTPRALPLAGTGSNTMTIKTCQDFCLSKNLPLAGLEYGQECWCGTALQSNSTLGYTGCDMPCLGAPGEICGGSGRLSVYNYTAYVAPQQIPIVGNYKLQGCWSEPSGARALPSYTFSNATGMSAELCVGTCEKRGFSWAGMEFGRECWCANALNANSQKLADSQCNSLCPGNKREYCGAGSKLTVYKLDPTT